MNNEQSEEITLMPFKYYKRLTASQRRVYDKSDEVTSVVIPKASELYPVVHMIEEALFREDKGEIEIFCQKLVSSLTTRLKTPSIQIKVLAVRPHNAYGELHGLYNPSNRKTSAMITVWMRTAQLKKVAAFRTFLRTLLHELCHHLDYEYFRFPHSFHTEGFYKRESSLFHQLVKD
ncbi:MAG: hypothetical protein OEW69_07565 [Nitrospirota bacterium]|nr:hypothetical protein [Nitrospirota bacterium]